MMDSVFVDTSGFKALVDFGDEFHREAASGWKRMAADSKIGLVTSNYVLDEAYTLIRAKCGVGVVKNFRKILVNSADVIRVMRVSLSDESAAWEWFDNDWSKLSYTDCVSFAMMRRLKLTKYFGFDRHFERAGFSSWL